jgi:iron complex outermembrane receptor protein
MKNLLPWLALVPLLAYSQEDAVVVSATRAPQPSLEVPASIDRIHPEEIRDARPQVNLSESLGRVPGIVVQNRHNYAQDLQISSRGFGARSTFGVRGIRLIADGIPATMPDGQGQAATFALGSARSIEVLRGPFSSLYGNAAGGVIAIETQDGPQRPTAEASFLAGGYDTWRGALKAGGQWGGFNAIAEVSRFQTDGYREHSAATRDHLNTKLRWGLGADTSLTLVANALRQPQTQDPLGLTRAQFEADPRQAVAPAFTFDTRKSVYQEQIGATLAHRLTPSSRVHVTAYGGERWVEQYLAFAGAAPATTSGGVVQLDRGYGGGALRYFSEGHIRFSTGIEHERMAERRRGFVNLNGVQGGLRRDEDDTVASTDLYAQAEWPFAERWSLHGGLRTSRVEFEAEDHYIVPGNPDDSGRRSYSATTPVAGLLFRLSRNVSLYGNLGRGFETPTFAELAHQNPPATGLNFGLAASKSRHAEAGIKAVLARLARVNFALFDILTRDEIVVDNAANGRTVFKNAGRTSRRGFELGGETLVSESFDVQFAFTRLEAQFKDGFTSGAGSIPAGNFLPGVPRSQAFVHLRYRQPAYFVQLEALRRSAVQVNDANSESAPAYAVANLAGGLVQERGRWRTTQFVRVDNLTDRNYIGSVIVNDANGRFYEPSPRRNMTVGVQASVQF